MFIKQPKTRKIMYEVEFFTVNGVKYGVKIISVTYSELLAKRAAGELMPGVWYRITDYVTTTA